MGRVYPIPDGYWAGYGISFKNFRRYGSGMGLGDTRPDYPKSHTRLPEITYPFTRTIYPITYPVFFNIYFYFPLTLVY
ncbi:hypothetical protein Hanom_Chr07g00633971 [Helianthus anomalus]